MKARLPYVIPLFLVGLFFIGMSGYRIGEIKKIESVGIKTTGTITKLNYNDEARIRYEFVYTDTAGKQHIHKHRNAFNDYGTYKLGQQETIIYNPANPKQAFIDRWSERYPLDAALIGVAFIGMGVFTLGWKRKEVKG